MNVSRFILLCSLYAAIVTTSTTLGMLSDNANLSISENEFTSETHEMYGYQHFVLTSDNKYYITAANHYEALHPGVLLWDVHTKEKKHTFENYDSFVYLQKKKIILLLQKMAHKDCQDQQETIGIY